eukprot:SAG11_NODE_6007_length_1410_cov_6.308924_1_plen_299_part_00
MVNRLAVRCGARCGRPSTAGREPNTVPLTAGSTVRCPVRPAVNGGRAAPTGRGRNAAPLAAARSPPFTARKGGGPENTHTQTKTHTHKHTHTPATASAPAAQQSKEPRPFGLVHAWTFVAPAGMCANGHSGPPVSRATLYVRSRMRAVASGIYVWAAHGHCRSVGPGRLTQRARLCQMWGRVRQQRQRSGRQRPAGRTCAVPPVRDQHSRRHKRRAAAAAAAAGGGVPVSSSTQTYQQSVPPPAQQSVPPPAQQSVPPPVQQSSTAPAPHPAGDSDGHWRTAQPRSHVCGSSCNHMDN